MTKKHKKGASKKHIHKYQRVDIGVNKEFIVYRCVLDCTHYIQPLFIKGKKSICWRCGNPFTIQHVHSLMAKPHCSDCIKRRGDSTKPALTDQDINELVNVEDMNDFLSGLMDNI